MRPSDQYSLWMLPAPPRPLACTAGSTGFWCGALVSYPPAPGVVLPYPPLPEVCASASRLPLCALRSSSSTLSRGAWHPRTYCHTRLGQRYGAPSPSGGIIWHRWARPSDRERRSGDDRCCLLHRDLTSEFAVGSRNPLQACCRLRSPCVRPRGHGKASEHFQHHRGQSE